MLAAVGVRDKNAWLDLFAVDAVVEDPVGPSVFDPEGQGHRGRDAISAFWDKAIAPSESIEFLFEDSFACGNEIANTGKVHSRNGSQVLDAEGVFTYRVDKAGKILAFGSRSPVKPGPPRRWRATVPCTGRPRQAGIPPGNNSPARRVQLGVTPFAAGEEGRVYEGA